MCLVLVATCTSLCGLCSCRKGEYDFTCAEPAFLSSPAEAKADALLVTALDEVAWLLNLRGSDVPYNPIFVSYALLTADAATLYVAPGKVGGTAPLQAVQCSPQETQGASGCAVLPSEETRVQAILREAAMLDMVFGTMRAISCLQSQLTLCVRGRLR